MSRTTRSREKSGYYTNVETYLRRNRRWAWLGNYDENEEIAWFNKLTRDGTYYEGNARRDYRHHTTKLVRADNRRKIDRLKKDVDHFDDMQFADKHDGKFYAWCVW